MDRLWAADLVDMQAFSKFNRNVKYILAVIDVFSKYGWSIPLKDKLYSTENEEKSSVVERWIKTMKEKMWKYFSANSTNVYINALPDLVREYNSTRHSSIKMTPTNASKKENKLRVWRNIYPDHLEIDDIKLKFSVGDNVRISKKKKLSRKDIPLDGQKRFLRSSK